MLVRPHHPTRLAERAAFLACLGLSLGLLLSPDSVKIRVANSLGVVVTGPFQRLRNFVADIGRVRQENAELQARVAALELERGGVYAYRRDADRLRAALGLLEAAPGSLLPCEAVARQSGRFPSLLKIRSARPAPWKRYLPVVSPTGLLGRVRDVTGPYEAWVELLTSPDLALGCEVERNGVLGILRSRGADFELEMVARDAEVEVGDRIVTSGLAELRDVGPGGTGEPLFPRGLPVGLVSHVASPPEQIFKAIRVEPLASFTHNDVVFVVTAPGTWYLPAPAAPDTVRAGAAADSNGTADGAAAGGAGGAGGTGGAPGGNAGGAPADAREAGGAR